MQVIKKEVKVVSQRILANVSEKFAEAYQLPEGHRSVGFFATDNDDIGYIAADDATKKADIKVVHAQTLYGGRRYKNSTYTGTVFVMISGPKVQDVRSGMRYIKEFVETKSELYSFDDDPGLAYYAQTIPRAGKFFQEWLGIPEGQAYTYLVGAPVETTFALDQALKAGNTKMAHFWAPPTHANSTGAVLTGTESACRAATTAFIKALEEVSLNPVQLS